MTLPEWLFPATDQGVYTQAAVVAVLWIGAFGATWRASRDVRLFTFGLGFLVLAVIVARGFLH